MTDSLTLLHLQWPTSLRALGPWGSSLGLKGMRVCGAGPGCNNAGVARAICQVRHGGLEPVVLALGEGRREGTCPVQASPHGDMSVALESYGKNLGFTF